MKKILLLAFLIIFSVNVFGAEYNNWLPASPYHFNQIIFENTDFELTMYQQFRTQGGNFVSVGQYAEDWSELPACGDLDVLDANFFKPPTGCTLKGYAESHSYDPSPFSASDSSHEVTMTLNCPAGSYTIPTNYSYCVYNTLPNPDTISYSSNGADQDLTFDVLTNYDYPPFYDFNLFWSKANNISDRYYVHVWDEQEATEGNYWIKSVEFEVEDGCQITQTGVLDPTKSFSVGNWQVVINTLQHKKMVIPAQVKYFQQGVSPDASYTGCKDTYINEMSPLTNYGGASTMISTITWATTWKSRYPLIKFTNLGILAGSTIASAELDLYLTAFTAGTLGIKHMIRKNWVDMQATWNIYSTGNNWGTAGAKGASDINSGTEDTITINSTGWFRTNDRPFDVTGSLQEQVDTQDFGGWKLFSGNNITETMSSCNTGIPANRPKLKVTYFDPLDPATDLDDIKDINPYVEVKCDSLGFHDFNITLTDGDDHVTEIKTRILDLNAYYMDGFNLIPDSGPPGVTIPNGPYSGASWGFMMADAYGVTDYATDTNHYIKWLKGFWRFCKEDQFPGACILPQQDPDCYMVESFEDEDLIEVVGGDYNTTIGGQIQHIYDENFLICSTPGHRKIMFIVASTEGSNNYFLDVEDLYFLDLNSTVYPPYYGIVDKNNQITGMSFDNDSYGDIAFSGWYAYDDECGAKTGWILDEQTNTWIDMDGDMTNDDVEVTATINCSTKGEKAINLVTKVDKGFFGPSGSMTFRNDTILTIISNDSIIMDAFAATPEKVKEGSPLSLSALVRNKMDSATYGVDLNVNVQFQIFDKEEQLIDTISVIQLLTPGQQKDFKTTFDTTGLNENEQYKVIATAYIQAGLGPIPDGDPVNDILTRNFSVLTSEDKLSNLPETNYFAIIIILITVTLILLKKE